MAEKIDDGGLAFPGKRLQQVGTVADFGFSDDESPTYGDVDHPGMSLRDWFATHAMQAALATSSAGSEAALGELFQTVAKLSYAAADAMIAARKAGA